MSARPRQRLRLGSLASGWAARVVVVIVGLIVLVYAIGLALLALKVPGETVNRFTGYRDVYDYLADLRPADASGRTRLIAGVAGLATFLVCGLCAWRERPRPRLSRAATRLQDTPAGLLTVRPRAIERAAEGAAARIDQVSGARGRLDDDVLVVELTITDGSRLTELAATTAVRVKASLGTHGLPPHPVQIVVTGFEPTTRKGLR